MRGIAFFFLHLMASIGQFGKRRANPEACPTNTMRFEQCQPCNEGGKVCEDKLSEKVGENQTFTGIEFDGKFFSFPALVGLGGLKEAILAIVKMLEFDIYLSVLYDGNNLDISHIGQVRLTKLVASDGTELSFEALCRLVKDCEYKLNVVGTVPPLTSGGSSSTLNNGTYNYSGEAAVDQETASTLQADVEAALNDLGVPFTSVTVTVDTDSGEFVISVQTIDVFEVMIGDRTFSNCGCKEVFIAEGTGATGNDGSGTIDPGNKGEESPKGSLVKKTAPKAKPAPKK